MFAIKVNPELRQDRCIVEFEDLIQVTLKYSSYPETRMRFKSGMTQRIFDPVFETRDEAQEYMLLMKEMDCLYERIASAKRTMAILAAKEVYAGRFKSSKPPLSSWNGRYREWQASGAEEILTEVAL